MYLQKIFTWALPKWLLLHYSSPLPRSTPQKPKPQLLSTIESREHSLHFRQDTPSVYSHHKTSQQLSLKVTQTGTITPRTLLTKKQQHYLIYQKVFANYHGILTETVRPINESTLTLVLCEVCALSRDKTWGCSSIKKFPNRLIHRLYAFTSCSSFRNFKMCSSTLKEQILLLLFLKTGRFFSFLPLYASLKIETEAWSWALRSALVSSSAA